MTPSGRWTRLAGWGWISSLADGGYSGAGDFAHYALTDHQFSVIAVIDSAANLLERVQCSAACGVDFALTTDNMIGFSGYVFNHGSMRGSVHRAFPPLRPRVGTVDQS